MSKAIRLKRCARCQEELPPWEFHMDKSKQDGLQSYCRSCKRTARYEIADKDDLTELWHQQGGRCAICREEPRSTLHIDHDHKTGDVRGLLCASCNLGLGKFRDSVWLLNRAADYLRGEG